VLTVAAIMAAMLAATGGNAFATNSGDTGYEDGTLPYIERSLVHDQATFPARDRCS
jgi:hypothetical protein